MTNEKAKSKENLEQEEVTSFTFDATGSGYEIMPSITKLLNRKKLGLSHTSTDTHKPLEPPPSAFQPPASAFVPPDSPSPIPPAPPARSAVPVVKRAAPRRRKARPKPADSGPAEISLNLDVSQTAIDRPSPKQSAPAVSEGPREISISRSESLPIFELPKADAATSVQASTPAKVLSKTGPTVKRGRRAKKNASSSLIKWSLQLMSHGTDPLGKGLSLLLKAGVTEALLLAVAAPTPEASLPIFTASAYFGSEDKGNIWAGLTWNPKHFPGLWGQFIQSEYLEIPPNRRMATQSQDLILLRTALGADPKVWLTLMRAGTVNACRGMLILFSPESIAQFLPSAIPLIGAPLPIAKRAA